MFFITLSDEEDQIINSIPYRKFNIKIGFFEEYFLSPLCYWSIKDYFCHWRDSFDRLLIDENKKTFFITEMYDPNESNFVRCWVVYRINDSVVFQEKLIFIDSKEKVFSLDNAFSFIPDYKNINEDGEEISEWRLSIEEFTDQQNQWG